MAQQEPSGVRLLASGEEALDSLIALADHAERTLDLQYYIIHQDESPRTLLRHVREAADRGVRVRVLVDDLNTAGEDRRFLHLERARRTSRCGCSIRFPAAAPRPGAASSPRSRTFRESTTGCTTNCSSPTTSSPSPAVATSVTNTSRSTSAAISSISTWWRPARSCRSCRASFDAFWNSKYAYPIASSLARGRTVEPTAAAQPPPPRRLERARRLARAGSSTPASSAARSGCRRRCSRTGRPRSRATPRPTEEVTIANNISALMRSAQHEVIVISPYFVPGEEGVELMRELTERGVHIRILTNSLASTDAPLVHIGYSRYRVALLKMGVELSEVRPKLGQKRPRFHPFSSSNASLHAKALVIDQKTVFIGSLNMDARSARFNSELGLVMRSPEIARQVTSCWTTSAPTAATGCRSMAAGTSCGPAAKATTEKTGIPIRKRRCMQRLSLKLLAPVRARRSCSRRGRRYGVMRSVREVVLDLGAESLAAGHRGAAGEHQDEVAAQRAVHLAHVVHVDQAGAADPQHGLRAQRLLGLAEACCGHGSCRCPTRMMT